jgi:eukaryotic-like serine/threonine-protein kinase
MSHDPSHPSHEQLNDLIDGRLDEARTSRVNAIVDECTECQAWLDAIMRDRAERRFGSREAAFPDLQNTVIGGRFRIGEEIARGGQGAVYKALHTDELGEVRMVAVKVFDLGCWDADKRYKLFRTEIIAHANLTHPNIVPIYDFGEHHWTGQDDGTQRRLAFCAMELQSDKTLEQQARPMPIERAAATVEVLARAMHYVHSKGRVHRDLKPRNVLVALDGALKLTDFGVASFIEKRADRLQYGPASGTRGFKAPEQVRADEAHIDPRTDVYGLAAILHDLLTGRPPELSLAPVPLRSRSALADSGRGRERDKGRNALAHLSDPSVGQHDTANEFGDLRRNRQQDLATIPRDLAAICLKGLAKDPADRYKSAEALAEDLGRFLARKPTEASPARWPRRVVMWAHRQPGWAAVTVVTVLAVTALLAEGIRYTQEIQQALAKAIAAENKAEGHRGDAERAAAEAQSKEATASATARFLTSIFHSSDPLGFESIGLRSDKENIAALTARQLLDRGVQRVRMELQGQDALKASMLDTLGNVYRSLGEFDQASQLLKEALEIRTNRLGDEHLDTAQSYFHLGWVHHDRGEFDKAEQLYRKALTIRKARLGKDDIQVADTMFNLGWLLSHQLPERMPSQERLATAEMLFREVIRIRREKLGDGHRHVGFALFALAVLLYGRGGADVEAPALVIQATLILDKQDRLLGNAISTLLKAEQARRSGKFGQAEQLQRQVIEAARRQLGNRHPLVGFLLGSWAGTLRQKGGKAALVQAEAALREALDIGRHSPLRWHPQMIEGLNQLADHVRARGNQREAEQLYREALALGEYRLKGQALYKQTLDKLTDLLRRQGREGEAQRLAASAQ